MQAYCKTLPRKGVPVIALALQALATHAERWASLGADMSRATPEQFDQTIRDEIATFTRSARIAKFQPE